MEKYPHLFSPITIRTMTVRNRIASTALATHYSVNGIDSRRDRDYFAARARGGVGLIVAGNRLVHPTSGQRSGRYFWGYLRQWIPAQRRLVDAVHEHGAAIVAQINHYGLNGASECVDDFRILWAPSAIRSPNTGEIGKAMDLEEIAEIVESWGETAAYVREAGFDGVEVHFGHSHLLQEFLSPIYNKRTDAYGGSIENRLRLANEVIAAIRRRVGPDFVVGTRMTLSEYMEGALTPDDAVRVAKIFEANGHIDYINCTAGGYHNGYWAPAPSDIPDGWLLDNVARVKAALTRLPVFAVGGMRTPAQAEEVLASGRADMVAMTRANIADAELANKVREGREEEVYHCIRCNQGCIGRLFKGLPMACTVNPVSGRERKFGTLDRASKPKHWVVVGGGPAGMKAAETLARRGHRVTLIEKRERLGGQVNMILKTPARDTFGWLIKDLETQMRVHGVEVRMGVEATPENVAALAPDGVIVATGAIPTRTGFSIVNPLVEQLPGADGENVLAVWDVLEETRPVGERVVVLDDDGTRISSGTIEVLLDRGKRVILVIPGGVPFPSTVGTMEQPLILKRLFDKGLEYRPFCWARRIDAGSVTVYNLFTGAEQKVECDTAVLVTACQANDALYHELRMKIPNVHRIGDCVAPRRLDNAIYEGYLAGRELFSGNERYITEGELEREDEGEEGKVTA